jgi:hypothetical protein
MRDTFLTRLHVGFIGHALGNQERSISPQFVPHILKTFDLGPDTSAPGEEI